MQRRAPPASLPPIRFGGLAIDELAEAAPPAPGCLLLLQRDEVIVIKLSEPFIPGYLPAILSAVIVRNVDPQQSRSTIPFIRLRDVLRVPRPFSCTPLFGYRNHRPDVPQLMRPAGRASLV